MNIEVLSHEYQIALEMARRCPTQVNLDARDRVKAELDILWMRKNV